MQRDRKISSTVALLRLPLPKDRSLLLAPNGALVLENGDMQRDRKISSTLARLRLPLSRDRSLLLATNGAPLLENGNMQGSRKKTVGKKVSVDFALFALELSLMLCTGHFHGSAAPIDALEGSIAPPCLERSADTRGRENARWSKQSSTPTAALERSLASSRVEWSTCV